MPLGRSWAGLDRLEEAHAAFGWGSMPEPPIQTHSSRQRPACAGSIDDIRACVCRRYGVGPKASSRVDCHPHGARVRHDLDRVAPGAGVDLGLDDGARRRSQLLDPDWPPSPSARNRVIGVESGRPVTRIASDDPENGGGRSGVVHSSAGGRSESSNGRPSHGTRPPTTHLATADRRRIRARPRP